MFSVNRMFSNLYEILLPVTVFVLSFLLYWSTAARYPGWVDASLLLNSVRQLDLGVWVNTHNLYNVLGFIWLKVFSAADPHFALSLFSSLMGSMTVLFLYLANRELTSDSSAAFISSAAIAFSFSLWWHSTAIEVYSLNTAIIGLFLYLVFRAVRREGIRTLYSTFFVGGLGVSNHVLMALYIFAFIVLLCFALRRRFKLRPPQVFLLILCYIAGTSLFAFLMLLQWRNNFRYLLAQAGTFSVSLLIRSFVSTFKYAAGGEFLEMMFSKGMPVREKIFWRLNYIFLIILNYPSAAIILIFSGLRGMWRLKSYRMAVIFFITGLCAQIIWSANYFIWDMYAFALPVYVMLALPLAVGLHNYFRNKKSTIVSVLLILSFFIPPFLYPSFTSWPGREKHIDKYIAMYPEAERAAGIWDPVRYIFNPVKRNYRGVEQFADGVLAVLPDGACYWDDESKALYPLKYYYQGVLNLRKDIRIQSVFGIVMDEKDARRYAARMRSQLESGRQVFLSAIIEPEREILNQLYSLLRPDLPIEFIRQKNAEDFCISFPEYEIAGIPFKTGSASGIYQIRKRTPEKKLNR